MQIPKHFGKYAKAVVNYSEWKHYFKYFPFVREVCGEKEQHSGSLDFNFVWNFALAIPNKILNILSHCFSLFHNIKQKMMPILLNLYNVTIICFVITVWSVTYIFACNWTTVFSLIAKEVTVNGDLQKNELAKELFI